ncbi:MAG: hypothetical protein GY705_14885 [Bacteroidetes bacterium]|nr:hypothetical protein [Bacteroidota bacterium]
MTKLYPHKWVDGVQPDEVRGMIERTFGFLETSHGFEKPVDRSISTMVIALSYRGQRIAIEPLVDRKDCFVETCIVQLKDGRRPEGWKVDDEGHQFMTRLFEAAWDRGVKHDRDNAKPATPHEQLQSLLDQEVMILREGFRDFLADNDGYFTDLNLKNAQSALKKVEKDFFTRAEELYKGKQFSELASHLSKTEYSLSKLWEARLAYAKNKS